MWCQNGTAGNNVVLGSQLQVDSTGRYGYVIADDFPAQKDFPVACHAQLAVEANGAGTDGPVGITWTSQLARAAKTLSLTSSGSVVSTTSPPAPVSTSATAPVNSPSSSVPVATGSTSSRSTSPSAASSSRETAPPASLSSSSSSTSSSSSPTDTSTSPNATNGATSSTDSKPSASNNVGAIVGGVIGGLALLCFIIFGALFLRKYQRNHDSTTPKRTPSHSWWRRTYRTTEMQTGGLHEKDGDVVLPRLEKDGNQLHEVVGDMPTRHEKEASLIKNRRYTPIELPT
ncbi:hypothetical protein BKA64DRAFT_86545 [Cadophora sp. MPI-SDFR-AT-0126]|nr:hypothetical protein BKA64DRAFT_86545 [Leotiomycetes sp. MPI-SDFR-AT-0126]